MESIYRVVPPLGASPLVSTKIHVISNWQREMAKKVLEEAEWCGVRWVTPAWGHLLQKWFSDLLPETRLGYYRYHIDSRLWLV